MTLFGEGIDHKVVAPSLKNLYTVNKKTRKLNETKSKNFQSVVAKLLFIMKRARLDLEPTVLFLTTRVSKSDEENARGLRGFRA